MNQDQESQDHKARIPTVVIYNDYIFSNSCTEAFGTSLQGYYNNKCLSDVVIRCNGQEFAVHSLVLFCHSDYFKEQLTESWKESADKIIEILDFDTNIVEAMLRFIYSFDCDVRPNTPPMIFHAKVYQIGDKYGIETLKKQASNKVERIVNEAEVATKYSPPYEEFGASLKNYFNNTTLSDATIRCEGRYFSVHSLILFCHSEYFRKQLDGPWKESSERVIDILDFDPPIVEAMTLFLYCFDYESPADSSAMMFHAKVYQIADKYGIEALKRLSATKFRASIDENWKTDDFPVAIALAYTTTPPEDRGLRDITVQVAFNNIGTLMSRDAFCEILSDNPDLAADIIRFMHGKWEELEEYKCSTCESVFLIGTVTIEIGNSLPMYCPRCKARKNSRR
ncbi:hypothetical protein FOBRF1_016570 [Fusarium oxysporum]